MYQSERLNKILAILKEYKYVTVKYLINTLHYSSATINRDLNALQEQKLVRRTHGGVEILESASVALKFRYHKMKAEKKTIAAEAAKFIKNGDVIFIDGSTTAQYIGEYITNKKNLTVITNNMYLSAQLAMHNIKVVCLGGSVVESPYMLSGDDTVLNAQMYKADKMFFSTGSFDENGQIGASGTYFMLHKTMHANSKQSFFLADHDKLNISASKIMFNFSDIDYVISDYRFKESVHQQFPDTKIICVDSQTILI